MAFPNILQTIGGQSSFSERWTWRDTKLVDVAVEGIGEAARMLSTGAVAVRRWAICFALEEGYAAHSKDAGQNHQ